jgi:amidase
MIEPQPSALELADRLRRRELSTEELVRDCLARIERLDPTLHAFVDLFPRRALAAARRADAALARGGAPRFTGVPIGIKDVNFVRGAFTRAGSHAFRWMFSPLDDRTVARLRGAGFVILGKLATSELGAMPVTEPDTHAPTRNPWNLELTPGGSSGGSAAAVASGMLPIAQGSDGAGSIRIPSALCGLVGLKPTRGRVAEHIGKPQPRGLAVNGPIARTVDDAAAMLDVLDAGPPPPKPFLELARDRPRRLRIRVATRSSLCTIDPEIAAIVERTARRLGDLGHEILDAPMLTGELDEFLPLWQHAIGHAPVLRPGLLQPVTRWLYDAGKQLAPGAMERAHDVLIARIAAWFGDADVMLTPTVAVAPPSIGAWKARDPRGAFEGATGLGAFTAPFNISGQPAISIPAGRGSWGTPIGVQLGGRAFEEGTLLALANQLAA